MVSWAPADGPNATETSIAAASDLYERGRAVIGGRCSTLSPRQLISVGSVRRGDVEGERLQRRAAGVANLMRASLLDQHERARTECMPASGDDGHAAPRQHEEPLIGA